MSIRHSAHFCFYHIYRRSFSWATLGTTHVTWSINWVSYSSPKSNQCHATKKSSPSKRLAGIFNLVSTSLNNVWCVGGEGGGGLAASMVHTKWRYIQKILRRYCMKKGVEISYFSPEPFCLDCVATQNLVMPILVHICCFFEYQNLVSVSLFYNWLWAPEHPRYLGYLSMHNPSSWIRGELIVLTFKHEKYSLHSLSMHFVLVKYSTGVSDMLRHIV